MVAADSITVFLTCISNGLQAWMAAVQASRDKGATTAVVAAAAMFVVLVTRTNDEWANWSEHDNMFVRYGSYYGSCFAHHAHSFPPVLCVLM